MQILSLQSRVFDMALPVVVVVLLTGLAVLDFNRQPKTIDMKSLAALAVHMSVLCWYVGLGE